MEAVRGIEPAMSKTNNENVVTVRLSKQALERLESWVSQSYSKSEVINNLILEYSGELPPVDSELAASLIEARQLLVEAGKLVANMRNMPAMQSAPQEVQNAALDLDERFTAAVSRSARPGIGRRGG